MYKFKLGEYVFAYDKKDIYKVMTIKLTRNFYDEDNITYTLYDESNNHMLENVPEFYITSTKKLEDLTRKDLIDFITFYHEYNDKNNIKDLAVFLNTKWADYKRNKNNRLSDEEQEMIKKMLEE